MNSHFILYVADPRASAGFYSRVLGRPPSLDVPGMTEFELTPDSVLGLMPASGIRRLLGDPLPDLVAGNGVAKAELYLVVEGAQAHHARALAEGARELSPLGPRSWGHEVAYSLDPDGYVLAFAEAGEGDGVTR